MSKKLEKINSDYDNQVKIYKKNYDDKINDLSTYYSNEKKALIENQNKSKQEADITYQKLKKYLPLEARANGSNAIGLSEQMQLNAGNAYAQRIASIDSEVNEQNRLVGQAETEAKSQAKTSYENDLQRAYETKIQREDIEEQNIKESQNAYYDNALDTASLIAEQYMDENGKITEEGIFALEKYVSKIQDKVGDNSLEPLLDLYRQEYEKNKNDSEKIQDNVLKPSVALNIKNTFRTSYEPGDDFEVWNGQEGYRVESRGETSDTNVIAAAKDFSDGQIFGYNNEVYLKINGKVYNVNMRGSSDVKGGYAKLRKLIFENK